MKISFHIDDHADADELAKLKSIIAILEGGEPTSTVELDEPVAPPRKPVAAKPAPKPVAKKPVEPEEPADDTPPEEPAEEPAEPTDELDAATLLKIKEAARKVMATKGPEATKKVLTSFKVERITELKPDQAQAAIAAFLKAAK